MFSHSELFSVSFGCMVSEEEERFCLPTQILKHVLRQLCAGRRSRWRRSIPFEHYSAAAAAWFHCSKSVPPASSLTRVRMLILSHMCRRYLPSIGTDSGVDTPSLPSQKKERYPQPWKLVLIPLAPNTICTTPVVIFFPALAPPTAHPNKNIGVLRCQNWNIRMFNYYIIFLSWLLKLF